MNNVELIRHIYERFAQRDVAAVLAAFVPEVEFRLAEGHPYRPDGKPWIGRDALIQGFFMKAGAEWQGWDIALEAILDFGNAVVTECRYKGLYKPTGKTMDVQVCHVWRLSAGKILSFHQYLDTARLQNVMGYAQGAAG